MSSAALLWERLHETPSLAVALVGVPGASVPLGRCCIWCRLPTCFLLGSSSLIAVLEGPSANPMPLEVILRPASDDGLATPGVSPLLQRSLGAAVNRLVILRVPAASGPLLWESSYQCGQDEGADEFGFITASAPPALTLLLPGADSEAESFQQQLVSFQAACGNSTAVAPLRQAFDFGDEVIDESWPQDVTVQCF